MGRMSGFILSLVCVAAGTALIDGFVPDGAMKKYVRYLVSLIVLLMLVSPIRRMIGALPSLTSTTSGDYAAVDALARANSIVARHIEEDIAKRFSLRESEVQATYDGVGISVRVRKHIGIIESDVELYVMNTYGVEVEVELYE